jgi:drug/metabolite transporter (DMT)-like permease
MVLVAPSRTANYGIDAILAALASSICLGIVPYLAVQLYNGGFTPLSVLVWRIALSSLILIVMVLVAFPAARLEWRNGWSLSLVGLLGAAQSYCFFTSIKTLPTSFATLVLFTYPLTAVIVEHFVFSARLTIRLAIAVPLVIFGAMLALYPGFQSNMLDWIGVLWVLPVPFIYAFYLAFSARNKQPRHPISRAIRLQVGMMATFLPLLFVEGIQVPISNQDWIWVLLCAVCGGALAISLFSYGIIRMGASAYGVVSAVELITIVGMGIFVLNEVITVEQLIGMMFILSAVIASSWQSHWLTAWWLRK